MANTERSGIDFINMETCYVVGCPEPRIDHEFYNDYIAIDPKMDGYQFAAMTRRVLDRNTGNKPIAFRHWWHSIPSGFTGEQSEYVLIPRVAQSQSDYELEKAKIEPDGRTYSRVSRKEFFTLVLAELKHHHLI